MRKDLHSMPRHDVFRYLYHPIYIYNLSIMGYITRRQTFLIFFYFYYLLLFYFIFLFSFFATVNKITNLTFCQNYDKNSKGPAHDNICNKTCSTSEDSDQPDDTSWVIYSCFP